MRVRQRTIELLIRSGSHPVQKIQLQPQNALSNLKTIKKERRQKKSSASTQEQQSAEKPSTKAGRGHLLYCQRQQLACSILKSKWKGSLEATSRSEARATELKSDSGSVKIFLPLKVRPITFLETSGSDYLVKRCHTNRRKAKPFKHFSIAPCSSQNSTSLFATKILKHHKFERKCE